MIEKNNKIIITIKTGLLALLYDWYGILPGRWRWKTKLERMPSRVMFTIGLVIRPRNT